MRRTTQRRRARRGFLLADILVAMAVLAILTTAMAMLMSKARHGERALARQRSAMRLAEAALTRMQAGIFEGNSDVALRPLDDPALPGWRWVEVTVVVQGQQAALVGLVPHGAEVRAEVRDE